MSNIRMCQAEKCWEHTSATSTGGSSMKSGTLFRSARYEGPSSSCSRARASSSEANQISGLNSRIYGWFTSFEIPFIQLVGDGIRSRKRLLNLIGLLQEIFHLKVNVLRNRQSGGVA